MIAASAILETLWRNWKLLLGGLAILLVAAWGTHEHIVAGRWEDAATKNKGAYERETLAHAVTRTSVNMLQTALDEQSRAVRGLAAESDARTLAAGDAKKAAQAAVQAAERTAAALDASAATPRAGAAGCPPSETFWNVRGSL